MNIYSVNQINTYIKNVIEEDVVLNSIFISGEVSNFKAHSSGHLYFTLKDTLSSINCVMFKGAASNLKSDINNGSKVILEGHISVYEKAGQYQVYVQDISLNGRGDIYLEFEKLKNRLDKVGLFDQKYKKSLPSFPNTIAIITSPTGAVVRDIINVSNRRNKSVKLIVVPTLVQGDLAPNDIVKSINLVNRHNLADLIILGRGGGSMEDLWAFNNENVARSIFESEIPIISAVGHETDFTISDFISDLRAPTPSAAAEIALTEVTTLNDKIIAINLILNNVIFREIELLKSKLDFCKNNRYFKYYLENLKTISNKINQNKKLLNSKIKNRLFENKLLLTNSLDLIETLSPLKTLKRGYSVILDENDNILKSTKDLKVEDKFRIKFYDGELRGKVID